MQKRHDDSKACLTAFVQDNTVIAVIEISLASWLVAGLLPGVNREPLKKIAPDPEVLLRFFASPTRKLPAFTNFGTTNRCRARKRPAIPSTRLYRTSATNNPLKKPMIPNVPPLPGGPAHTVCHINSPFVCVGCIVT
jgi:hypothetical protein